MAPADVTRAFARVAQRFRLLVSLGRLVLADDSGPIQVARVEGLVGELRDGVQRFGEWGLASTPPAGAELVLVALGGNREDLVAIAVEDRGTRPKDLPEGATRLYSSSSANRWQLNPDGSIEGVGDIDHTGALDVTGDVTVTGTLTVTGSLVVNGIDFSTHVHADPTSGVTGPPQ